MVYETGSAIFNNRWRYNLTRESSFSRLKCTFVMLNPSTATATEDDATTIRVCRLVMGLGFGRYEAVNLFALVSSDPRDLRDCVDPVGPSNDEYITRACKDADKIVVAWGNGGRYLDRDSVVLAMLSQYSLWCLGLTKLGCPRFPLYLSKSTPLRKFESDERLTMPAMQM